MIAVRFSDVWEMFRIKFSQGGRQRWENYWALRDINLSVFKGESLGIVGENGSGKTTILKLIAGVLNPDRGKVEVSGRAAGLLELGAGFQPELSGRENILFSAGMHGYGREKAEQKLREVADFARLGDFIDAQVKSYSQGMFVRLAFSFAVSLEPDVLLIDDSLAVGDDDFQRRCLEKIQNLKESGKTIIFVTHDQSVLNKIATRAVLLKNGRIIEDSLPHRVSALYSLVCGKPEGRASLEIGKLRVVFNNGGVFFFWNGIPLATEKGLIACLPWEGKWFASSSGEWTITGGGPRRVEAEGGIAGTTLALKWVFELKEDLTLEWEMFVSDKNGVLPEVCQMQIGFDKVYAGWFTNSANGKAGAMPERPETRAVSEVNRYAGVTALTVEDGAAMDLPNVVLEPRLEKYTADAVDIFTEEKEPEKIMLRCRQEPLSSAPAWHKEAVCFSGRLLFRAPAGQPNQEPLSREREIVSGDSKFIFRSGELQISTGGSVLTSSRHICCEFYRETAIYDSRVASWVVRKITPNKIVACGSWEGASFKQLWEISLDDGGILSLKVAVVCSENTAFIRQRLQLMCHPSYSAYFSGFGSGEFPVRFFTEECDVLQRCIPCGEIGLSDNDGRTPSLLMSFQEAGDNFAKILNSDLFNRSRILRVERVAPGNDGLLSAGRHECFSISVRALPPGSKVGHDASLRSGDCELFFRGGKLDLVCSGRALTRELGIYSAFRSQGRWYDSGSKAEWKINEHTENSLNCSARWRHLPLKQNWRISAAGNGRFSLDVVLEVTDDLEVDRRQLNIMLNEVYSLWSHPKGHGTFGEFPRDIDDDWQTIVCLPEDGCSIAAEPAGRSFSRVRLYAASLGKGWRLEAVNSDLCYRGRVLRRSNKEKEILKPGEYQFFSGDLIVEK